MHLQVRERLHLVPLFLPPDHLLCAKATAGGGVQCAGVGAAPACETDMRPSVFMITCELRDPHNMRACLTSIL